MSYRKIRDEVLKNGQLAEVAVVIAPDADWLEKLCNYLNAPPEPEGPSRRRFLLTQDLKGMEARYFMMLQNGAIVGCIVTTDSASVGYINSTFVPRPLRQLGIARSLMAALEEDFSVRGGKVRFLTTRTGSPAEGMFEKFGYQAVWKRSGRTGMEKHYGGSSWKGIFSADPSSVRVEDMAWVHWLPHQALMWTREKDGYHPLDGAFLIRMRESLFERRTHWKALVTPDGMLVGNAVLRLHDWADGDLSYVLDLYVHPRFRSGMDMLFEAAMPKEGNVETFLDGRSEEQIAFFHEKGFRLEVSLRDDFDHHDDSTPDIRVYQKSLGFQPIV